MVTQKTAKGPTTAKAPAAQKTKKHRSPLFPFIPLRKAVERIKTLHEREGRHASRFSVVTQHWGYRLKSSGGPQTLGALRQYGLVTVDDGSGVDRLVRLTDRALRIILDKREGEAEKAIREAAL